MTSRRIRTNSDIFFPNPHVIRISYPQNFIESMALAEWRLLVRQTYKAMTGTWGHTGVKLEFYRIKKEGVDYSDPLSAIFGEDYFSEYRGYFCFRDELDVLQFRLMSGAGALNLEMWPSDLKFQFHEFIDE